MKTIHAFALWYGFLATLALVPLGLAESCQCGWLRFGDKCYNFDPNSRYHDDCMTNCAAKVPGQSSMLCIQNVEENDFIRDNILYGGTHLGYARRGTNTEFMWVDGCDSIYTNWAPGQPDNWANSEPYATMYTGPGTWYDRGSEVNNCACEYTLLAPSDDDGLNDCVDDDIATPYDTDDGASSVGVIVGATMGAMAFIFILSVCCVCYCRYAQASAGVYGAVPVVLNGQPRPLPSATLGAPASPYAPAPASVPVMYAAVPVSSAPPALQVGVDVEMARLGGADAASASQVTHISSGLTMEQQLAAAASKNGRRQF